jgi:hypothetical protein
MQIIQHSCEIVLPQAPLSPENLTKPLRMSVITPNRFSQILKPPDGSALSR